MHELQMQTKPMGQLQSSASKHPRIHKFSPFFVVFCRVLITCPVSVEIIMRNLFGFVSLTIVINRTFITVIRYFHDQHVCGYGEKL